MLTIEKLTEQNNVCKNVNNNNTYMLNFYNDCEPGGDHPDDCNPGCHPDGVCFPDHDLNCSPDGDAVDCDPDGFDPDCSPFD